MNQWCVWEDFVTFACSLPKDDRIGFLITLSAVCWTIWKHRNEVIFTNCSLKSARTIILQIKTCCLYWSGLLSKKIKTVTGEWLPVEEDIIPLNQIAPMAIVPYQPRGGEEGVGAASP